MKKSFLLVFNYLLFYLGWVVSIRQAVQGDLLTGPLCVLLILCFHLWMVKNKREEIQIVLWTALLGSLTDLIYIRIGMMQYAAPFTTMPWMTPGWLMGIWVLFGICINHSLIWMQWYPKISTFVGAIAAALCYLGAARFGAAILLFSPSLSACVIIFVWMIYLPILFWGLKKIIK